VIDLSSSSDEEDLIADTSHNFEFAQRLYDDSITSCRKSSKDGSSKSVGQPLLTTPSVLPIATAHVHPPSGGTSMTIQSTAEASDSARCLAEYLEGLKNAEADREGTHFSFVTSSLRSFLLVS
jgi:hypothetical protein